MQKFLHKKAAIDVQFNWIFVLIIGALILVFFISVMKTSEKSATKSTYQSITLDLKNLFTQTELDVRNSRTIKLPNIIMNFECDEFTVEKSSSYQEIKYKTIFSPNKIKGRELLTYTNTYNIPYPVDYFVYMTSNQVRYDFVDCTVSGCDTLKKELISMLPVNSTILNVKTDFSNVKNDNYYKERFIFIGTEPSSEDLSNLEKLNDKDVTAIYIIDSNLKYGKFFYYEKNGKNFIKLSTQHSYLGKEMLAGAVISDSELYDCNVKKSLSKFKILTYLYSNRLNNFTVEYSKYKSNTASQEYSCYQIYKSMSLNSTLSELILNTPRYAIIFDNNIALGEANKNLISNSCPLLY